MTDVASTPLPNKAQALLDRVPCAKPLTQNIPAELTQLTSWVAWAALEKLDKKTGELKVTKPPLNANELAPALAKGWQKPASWASFGTTMAFCSAHSGEAFQTKDGLAVVAGIGLVLAPECGANVTGIDLDDCLEPATGTVLKWAQPLVQAMLAAGMYVEASPSGTGFRAFCLEPLPPEYATGGNPDGFTDKKTGIEVYASAGKRFLTVTGHMVEGAGTSLPAGPDCATILSRLWSQAHPPKTKKQKGIPLPPAPAIQPTRASTTALATGPSEEARFKAMFGGPDGAKRKELFYSSANEKSTSENDIALVNTVVKYFGPDPALCEQALMKSKRYHYKWDKNRGNKTFLQMEIENAIATFEGKYWEDEWREWMKNNGNIVPNFIPTEEENAQDLSQQPTPDEEEATQPVPTTQDGLATAFVFRHGRDIRYCHTVGKWFQWNGVYWQVQETKLAFHWCRVLCREFAKQTQQKKTYAELKRVSTASAVEKFAQADPKVAVTHEAFDRDPWLLGTPAGTVNLKTGTLEKARRDSMITKLAGASPEAGPCPCWRKFLDEATKGDAEMVRYIQQLAGYMLTGTTDEQILIFVYGPGGNGKSVFLNVLRDILNDYAKTASMDTFMASKNDRHPTDLAMLAGARIVTASETEDGRTWAEGRIKELTGQDPVTARFMRQDFFTYVPQFKLLLIGNHAPQLRNVGEAITRRFRVIPFLFKPETPDKTLPQKLKAEYPQILHWMVQGCLDWQLNGLITPQNVKDYTQSYLDSQDIVKQWIEECCDLSTSYITKVADLFKSWSTYARQFNIPERSSRWLTSALVEKINVERERGSGNASMLRGISLTIEEANRLKNGLY